MRDGQRGLREYHRLSRDWISNEIFRRIHPEGLTMGEYLERKNIGIYCGNPPRDVFA